MSTIARRRRELTEVRLALLERLAQHEGAQSGAAELVQEVSLDQDVESSHVVAAMWTLVDDGEVEYEPGARLRRLVAH